MKYYRLIDDITFPGRWYLGEIVGIDNWALSSGEWISYLKLGKLSLEIYQDGIPMDFTLNEAFVVAIVSEKVKDRLQTFPGI
jgi:hypothetical protein